MPSSGREYVRLYAALAANPKWGRLPLLLRGAWTSLLVYAATRNDPTFTHEQAVWLLKRDGAKSAARLVDALVEAGWLDRDGETVALHGWTEHQPAYRGPSDDPEYKRQQERARYQRSKSGAPSGTSWDDLGAPVTEERRGEERRGLFRASAHEESQPTPPPIWKPKDEKHLNSKTETIRDATRKAAEAEGIDWRALLKTKGEEPNE